MSRLSAVFPSPSPDGLSVRPQIETHVDGERVRYFQDDDSMGLQEMVRREKMSTPQDQNALYSRMAGKVRVGPAMSQTPIGICQPSWTCI